MEKTEKKVEIKSVEIQLTESKIKLSLEEAKKLYDCLKDLFTKEIIKEEKYIPFPINPGVYPYQWWYQPHTNPTYTTGDPLPPPLYVGDIIPYIVCTNNVLEIKL